MYLIYILTLVILIFILLLLWEEEKRFRKSISYGLANKFWVLRERRKFVRFKEEVKVRYNIMNKEPNLVPARTNDISRKGLCLLAYERLEKNDYLDIEIDIHGFSKPIRITGQVIWIKELQHHDTEGRRLFYIGVKIYRIDADSEAKLLTYLNTSVH